MADRKLAYIATISKIDKIPGKDRIVYASLKDLGWQVIVDTSYHEGDRVVYLEIDAILPVKPEYEFLRKRCFSEKWNGFVIKGMRMAGLVSYGLVLRLPEGYAEKPDGFDMTGILEIRKREDDGSDFPSMRKSPFDGFIGWVCRKLGIKQKRKSAGIMEGWLPFAHKTDETRIENLPYLFSDEFRGTPVYTTVKCDGQSATYAVYKDCFYIASRNLVLYREKLSRAMRKLNPKTEKRAADNFTRIAARYGLPKKMAKTGFIIQGELCGPGIQKNPLGLPAAELLVFNIYLPDKRVFLSWNGIEKACAEMGLKTVPFIEKRKFDWPDKQALKEYARGKYPNGKEREGVVIRYDAGDEPMPHGLRDMTNMWSFKCINDDYILRGSG